jgi:signal transduction histidine kinase
MGRDRVTALAVAISRAPHARPAPVRGNSWLKRGVPLISAMVAGSAILFGIPNPIHLDAAGGRAAIETLIAAAALVSARLLLASFRHERRRSDLLLLTALAAVGLTDFVFSALPALTGSELFAVGSGSSVACQALAAVAFMAAAFTPRGKVSPAGFGPLRTAGAVGIATIGLAVVTDVVAGQPALGATTSGTGIASAQGHPVLVGAVLFSSVLFLVAGAAFICRRDSRSHALGGASCLLAAARLQYLALPVVAADWVTARDGLRLAAYGLLLAVALSRFVQTRRAIAAATLANERERIARDLHDGLAQDLAYIALQGQRLSAELGAEDPLALAARRAVAASRGVIVDLSASSATTIEGALRQVANELGARFGTNVDVTSRTGEDGTVATELDPRQREHVVRIARESIVNAAKHGGARHVALALERTSGQVRLRVSDDGNGMPRGKLRGRGGYGLQMMRARATALGGRLVTRPGAHGGVEVELTFRTRSGDAR